MKFDDKQYLAQQIKLRRKELKLTQAQLAEMVDLSVQHISRIESGCYTPSLKSFFMLIKVLKLDLRKFGFNIEPTNNNLRDKLIDMIINSTDAELIFYENIMTAVNESLSTIKNKLL